MNQKQADGHYENLEPIKEQISVEEQRGLNEAKKKILADNASSQLHIRNQLGEQKLQLLKKDSAAAVLSLSSSDQHASRTNIKQQKTVQFKELEPPLSDGGSHRKQSDSARVIRQTSSAYHHPSSYGNLLRTEEGGESNNHSGSGTESSCPTTGKFYISQNFSSASYQSAQKKLQNNFNEDSGDRRRSNNNNSNSVNNRENREWASQMQGANIKASERLFRGNVTQPIPLSKSSADHVNLSLSDKLADQELQIAHLKSRQSHLVDALNSAEQQILTLSSTNNSSININNEQQKKRINISQKRNSSDPATSMQQGADRITFEPSFNKGQQQLIIEEQSEEIDKLKGQILQLKRKLDLSEVRRKELQEQIDSRVHELDELRQTYRKLQSDLIDVGSREAALQHEVQQQRAELGNRILRNQEEDEVLVHKAKRLLQRYDDIRVENQQLKQSLAALRDELDQMIQEKDMSEHQLKTQMINSEDLLMVARSLLKVQENTEIVNELKALMAQLREKNDFIQSLKDLMVISEDFTQVQCDKMNEKLIWKWIKGMYQEYLQYKQHKKMNDQIRKQVKNALGVEKSEQIMSCLTQKVVENEVFSRVVKMVLKFLGVTQNIAQDQLESVIQLELTRRLF